MQGANQGPKWDGTKLFLDPDTSSSHTKPKVQNVTSKLRSSTVTGQDKGDDLQYSPDS